MVYCWKCGTEGRDDAAFCHKCGAALRPGSGVTGQTGFEVLRDDKGVQNHWAKRVVAFIIDTAIVSIAVIILALIFAIPFLIGTTFPGGPAVFSWWWVVGGVFGGILPLIVLGYFILAEGLYGRTLGKQIMGLRVERVDGKAVDLWSAIVRNISKINIVLLILDVAVGLGMHGEMSQKFSDRYVGTKVETIAKMTIIS
jgi:uncharacterized RDD family membrane protein YckC